MCKSGHCFKPLTNEELNASLNRSRCGQSRDQAFKKRDLEVCIDNGECISGHCFKPLTDEELMMISTYSSTLGFGTGRCGKRRDQVFVRMKQNDGEKCGNALLCKSTSYCTSDKSQVPLPRTCSPKKGDRQDCLDNGECMNGHCFKPSTDEEWTQSSGMSRCGKSRDQAFVISWSNDGEKCGIDQYCRSTSYCTSAKSQVPPPRTCSPKKRDGVECKDDEECMRGGCIDDFEGVYEKICG